MPAVQPSGLRVAVQVFARVAIWTAIYAGAGVIGGVSLEEMVTYALLGGAVTGAARYETVIYVPRGDAGDVTRRPEELDTIADVLRDAGVQAVDTKPLEPATTPDRRLI